MAKKPYPPKSASASSRDEIGARIPSSKPRKAVPGAPSPAAALKRFGVAQQAKKVSASKEAGMVRSSKAASAAKANAVSASKEAGMVRSAKGKASAAKAKAVANTKASAGYAKADAMRRSVKGVKPMTSRAVSSRQAEDRVVARRKARNK